MKKYLLLLLAIVPFIISCSSSDDPSINSNEIDNKSDKQEVTINVKGFEEFTTSRSSLNDSDIKVIYYSLFKENKKLTESLGEAWGFRFTKGRIIEKSEFDGSITDTLSVGRYKITLLGLTNDTKLVYVSPKSEDLSDSYAYPYRDSGFWGHTTTSDFFFKEIEFEVKNNSINEDVTLKRLNGRVDIIPLDLHNAPANLKKLEIIVGFGTIGKMVNVGQRFLYNGEAVDYEPYSLTNDGQSLPLISDTYTKEDLKSINEKNPISLFLLPIDGKEKLSIYVHFEYMDGSQKYSIIKSEFKIGKNHILKLKGNLFPNTDLELGNIQIEDEWTSVVEGAFE